MARLILTTICLALVGAAPLSKTVSIEVSTKESDGGQCCVGACKDSNKNKYFSIADDSGPWLCGETCIRDSFYRIFHIFEKNLTKATDQSVCKDAGYTQYNSTVTHGGGGLDCTLDLYSCTKAGGCEHPGASAGSIFASTMNAGALTKRPWDMKIHLTDIKEVQVSVPVPKSGQVLIEVQGSSVNPVDWKLIESPYSLSWSYPHVFGRDFAGKVVAVGEGVTHLKVGDSVWGDNSQNEGSYAEYVAVDQSIVGLAPSNISLAEAGTLPLVALTGLEAFHFAQAPWQAGKTVVVLGGSGGTGHTGIQLAKALGASKVISTCGTSHVEFCKSQGADQVIDYHKANWHDVIAHQSVDVVYDTVAIKGTGDLAYDVLKDGGFFVTLLPDAVASKAVASKRPSIKQENFMLSQIQTSYLDTLKTFADAGKLRGHIDKTFSVSEIAAAFNASMAGRTTGKISVVPSKAIVIV